MEFLSREIQNITHQNHIYVHQQEFTLVEVSKLKSPFFIGSDDATTCVIVFIYSSSLMGCAHIDSPSQIDYFLDQIPTRFASETFQVSLIGGFEDAKGISAPILDSIFFGLEKLTWEPFIHCIGKYNTGPDGEVIQRGAIMNENGDVMPAYYESNCRGPDLCIRSLGSSKYPLHKCADFDSGVGIVYRIGPYLHCNYQEIPFNDLEKLLDLPDQILLQVFSTSPNCEGPKFVPDMRLNLKFVLESADAVCTANYTKIYENGEWKIQLQFL